MAKTESKMIALGTTAPYFSLPDAVSGQIVTLDKYSAGKAATLIMFICNHCPYVKHINKELSRIGHDYLPKEVKILAINSNDIHAYPDDAPKKMKIIAQEENYPFPYLFDETQEVALAYNAACTPDFFLFDSNLKLVYRGQLDDSRPGNGLPVTGESLRKALDALINGEPVPMVQKPSIGCNIKWK